MGNKDLIKIVLGDWMGENAATKYMAVFCLRTAQYLKTKRSSMSLHLPFSQTGRLLGVREKHITREV